MITIYFDIDGTLTDMWPLEKKVLQSLCQDASLSQLDSVRQVAKKDLYSAFKLVDKAARSCTLKQFRTGFAASLDSLVAKQQQPNLVAYPTVCFIKENADKARFCYATGGTAKEAKIVLDCLGIASLFDINRSYSRDNLPYPKNDVRFFKSLQEKTVEPFCFVGDSQLEVSAAIRAGICSINFKLEVDEDMTVLREYIKMYNGGNMKLSTQAYKGTRDFYPEEMRLPSVAARRASAVLRSLDRRPRK